MTDHHQPGPGLLMIMLERSIHRVDVSHARLAANPRVFAWRNRRISIRYSRA
jgi:hypothetical protein